ncbi:MAG: M28 family peptidase [Bacteroidetes bacterium]|nr:M28 family peptidase [Bacteroidota bacterium]
MLQRAALLLLCGTVLLNAQPAVKKKADPGNIEGITRGQLFDYLSFVASDELEGRDTPSRGLEIAAKFIATHLSRWGYTPAGDSGSFFQRILLHKTRVNAAATSVTVGGRSFTFGDGFLAYPSAGVFSAPLVFVQNGFIVRSKGIDPYAGLDVKGKVIVALEGLPKGVTRGDFGLKLGEDYDTPSNYAKNNGAAGLIIIPGSRSLGSWERDKNNAQNRGSVSVPSFDVPGVKKAVPTITASLALVDAIFAGEKTGVQSMSVRASADSAKPFALSDAKRVTAAVAVRIDTLYTKNIIAVWEGSDKKLKNEYVAFGAHYDHVGLRPEPLNGDSIYNGADDDGSGTVGLLSMAEALTKAQRPKRSMMFIWHTGEEKGLWGSKYFVQNPTVPLSSIVTQLNIDMIGRTKPDTGESAKNEDFVAPGEIFSIGSNMMSTQLGELNESVNTSLYNLKLNYKFDDPKDPNRLFYRSDHYNYAKNGIPIVFYFDGLHEDYHRVTDHVEKIDFDNLLKVTRTIYALGLKIADLPKRPPVDKTFEIGDDE